MYRYIVSGTLCIGVWDFSFFAGGVEEVDMSAFYDLQRRRKSAHKRENLTGFTQSSSGKGLALLNPYLSEKEVDDENEEFNRFKKKNFIQQFLISDHPSDLRLNILERLPQKWGLRVKRVAHKPMAEWYDPVNLLSTAMGALVTLVIGERTDTRPLYGVMDTVEKLKAEIRELKEELELEKARDFKGKSGGDRVKTAGSLFGNYLSGGSSAGASGLAGAVSIASASGKDSVVIGHNMGRKEGAICSAGERERNASGDGGYSGTDPICSKISKVEWFDYSNEKPVEYYERHRFTLDFIADTGDGWNPTFTVAQLLAQPELKIHPQDVKERGAPYEYIYLPRGRILVLGGDLVYPHPTPKHYQARFVEPFRHALWSEKKTRNAFEFADERGTAANSEEYLTYPHMFAIPGNHDWMDGLVAFRRLLCTGYRLGGWLLPQRRSYFANKLPDNWWLFGIDDQLTYDLDDAQFRYFKDICASFSGGETVIVCMHRPFWILDGKPPLVMSMLFEEIIGTDRLKLVLAGDLHNYSRYRYVEKKSKSPDSNVPSSQSGAARQKGSKGASSKSGELDPHCGYHLIVSGGGGAFLHPTHVLAKEITIEGTKRLRYENSSNYSLAKVYPRMHVSRRLNYLNVFFLYENLTFGVAAGVINTLLVGFLSMSMWLSEPSELKDVVGGETPSFVNYTWDNITCLPDFSFHSDSDIDGIPSQSDSLASSTFLFAMNTIYPFLHYLASFITTPLRCFVAQILLHPTIFCVIRNSLMSPLFCGMFAILWTGKQLF